MCHLWQSALFSRLLWFFPSLESHLSQLQQYYMLYFHFWKFISPLKESSRNVYNAVNNHYILTSDEVLCKQIALLYCRESNANNTVNITGINNLLKERLSKPSKAALTIQHEQLKTIIKNISKCQNRLFGSVAHH